MKKVSIIMLITVFLLSLSIPAMAKKSTHDVEITVESAVSQVEVGEKVKLTALTPKHGSSFTDEWSGCTLDETVLDNQNDNYVSTATFYASEPGIYTITYSINMKAGKSKQLFVGTKTKTIEVIGTKSIKEVDDSNLDISSVKNSEGNIIYYNAIGEIYITWSDNTISRYTIFITFYPDEFSKDVEIYGEKEIYTVKISR